jgi:hypothetical protein
MSGEEAHLMCLQRMSLQVKYNIRSRSPSHVQSEVGQ